MAGRHEPFLDRSVCHVEEGFPVTQRVEEHHWLTVQPQLCPRQHFAQFIERAKAPGQCHKCIGSLSHHRFAFVHRFDDGQRS
jgi:hypothetical protein